MMFNRKAVKLKTSAWPDGFMLICTFGMILSSAPSFSQDKVYKTDNTVIEAKVQEVGSSDIKYRKFSNPEGPVYVIRKEEVSMIVYENGEKEIYSQGQSKPQGNTVQTTPPPPVNGNSDLIVPVSGEDIACIIDKIDKTSIYYHVRKRGPDLAAKIPVKNVIRYYKKQQWYDAYVPEASNTKARNLVLSENINEAIASYAQLVRKDSANATLLAESAYALALGSVYEAALLRLDRSWSLGANSPDVNYLTSQVFSLLGYDDIADEVWKPTERYRIPSWIAAKAPELLEKYKNKNRNRHSISKDELIARFRLANEMASKNSYFQSIAMFHEIVDLYPGEFIPYIGYGITLEKTGALNQSQRSMEKAISLIGDGAENIQQKQVLQQHLGDIRQKMSLLPPGVLPGLYRTNLTGDIPLPQTMIYAGGSASPSLISINLRAGYFIAESSNASFDLGLVRSDSLMHTNLGFSLYDRSERYVYGVGFQLGTGGGSTAFYMKLSAGYSIMNRERTSSLDIFLDSSTLMSKGTFTTISISIGKSMYFGKRK